MHKGFIEVVVRLEYEYGNTFTKNDAETLIAQAVTDAVDKSSWLFLPSSRSTPEEKRITITRTVLHWFKTLYELV